MLAQGLEGDVGDGVLRSNTLDEVEGVASDTVEGRRFAGDVGKRGDWGRRALAAAAGVRLGHAVAGELVGGVAPDEVVAVVGASEPAGGGEVFALAGGACWAVDATLAGGEVVDAVARRAGVAVLGGGRGDGGFDVAATQDVGEVDAGDGSAHPGMVHAEAGWRERGQ